jgi:hypothetical protein
MKVRSENSQLALSCLGGCGLLILWVAVGVLNVVLSEQLRLEGWQMAVFFIVWMLSGPVVAVAFFKWRGLRHKKAFLALETKLSEKALDRIRRQSPDP